MDFEPAYLLHARPYRESSVLGELLVAERGRVGVVMRGARGKRSLPLFQPLLVQLAGQGELKTVKAVETAGSLAELGGPALFSGFYLNELLVRLLQRELPLPSLFLAYAQALAALTETSDVEPVLRRFEIALLEALGYGVEFALDCETGELVQAGLDYEYLPEQGFRRALGQADSYAGSALLALAAGEFEAATVRKVAKQVLRLALARHLGGKPLKSRELFLKG